MTKIRGPVAGKKRDPHSHRRLPAVVNGHHRRNGPLQRRWRGGDIRWCVGPKSNSSTVTSCGEEEGEEEVQSDEREWDFSL